MGVTTIKISHLSSKVVNRHFVYRTTDRPTNVSRFDKAGGWKGEGVIND